MDIAIGRGAENSLATECQVDLWQKDSRKPRMDRSQNGKALHLPARRHPSRPAAMSAASRHSLVEEPLIPVAMAVPKVQWYQQAGTCRLL